MYTLSRTLTKTPWAIDPQAPLPMGLLRQEHWSGLPFPSLGDLPHPGINPESPALAGEFLTTEPPEKPIYYREVSKNAYPIIWDPFL